MNAESLLLFVTLLIRHPALGAVMQFAPWILGTQAAENWFRQMREFTDVNFSVEGFLKRCSFALVHEMIRLESSEYFRWHLHDKHTHSNIIRTPGRLFASYGVTEDAIQVELLEARRDAILCLSSFGITVTQSQSIVSPPGGAPLKGDEEERLQHDPRDVDAEVEDLVAIGGDALEQFYRELNDATDQMDDDAMPPASLVVAAPAQPQQSRIEQLRVRLASVLSDTALRHVTLDFAGRNGTVVQPISSRTRFLRDEGSSVDVDKRAACAILSLHNSVSSDRVKRYKTVDRQAEKAPANPQFDGMLLFEMCKSSLLRGTRAPSKPIGTTLS